MSKGQECKMSPNMSKGPMCEARAQTSAAKRTPPERTVGPQTIDDNMFGTRHQRPPSCSCQVHHGTTPWPAKHMLMKVQQCSIPVPGPCWISSSHWRPRWPLPEGTYARAELIPASECVSTIWQLLARAERAWQPKSDEFAVSQGCCMQFI